MRRDDRLADRESDSNAIWLGRPKGIEDIPEVSFGDARTGISDLDTNLATDQIGADGQRLPTWLGFAHGVRRIQYQIQEHLLQLNTVAVDGRQGRRQRCEWHDVAHDEIRLYQSQSFVYQELDKVGKNTQ